jgi:hypothetical protein
LRPPCCVVIDYSTDGGMRVVSRTTGGRAEGGPSVEALEMGGPARVGVARHRCRQGVPYT